MISRPLRRTVTVLLVAAMLVVGLAVAAHAEEEITYEGSTEVVEEGCAEKGGAYFESNDGTYGVCIVDSGWSFGCDDIAIEGEDNCWTISESKVPAEARKQLKEIVGAVGDLGPPKKVPKRVRTLVNVLEVVAQPGYCDKKLSRRTQMLLEFLTVALLEGDRGGFETCGSSESTPVPEPGGSPDRSSSSTSSTSTSSSTTSSSTTSSTLFSP